MKINHFFLAITIALAAGACSDNTFIPAEDEETVSMSNAQSIQRSEDEAMAYAAQFLNIFPHKESRSLPDIKIHALTNKTSRSSASTDTMSGFVTPTSDGHAWVADGGLKVGTVRTHVDYGANLDGSNVVTVTENLEMLVHFNWGWGGYGNGYFNPEVFNPEDAESYDFMSSGMNKDYKYNLKYIAFYQEQMSIL